MLASQCAYRRKRKVFYLMSTFSGGGAERGLVSLLERGLFDGVDLHVIALARGDGGVLPALQKRLGRARVRALSPQRRVTKWLLPYYTLAYSLRAFWIRPETTILSLEHANLVGRIWATMARARVVSFEHSERYGSRAIGAALRALSGRVRLVVTDGTATTDSVLAMYFSRTNRPPSALLPLFGVPEAFPRKANYALNPHGPIRVAIAGRLAAVKNHSSLLHALARLNRQGLRCHLSIFGDGEERGSLEELTTALNLRDDVTFIGFAQNWVSQAVEHDMYIQPSLREGLCITVLEAMAAGLPVVASSVGEIPRYGRDQENILLLDSTDAASISHSLKLLSTSEELRTRVGINAAEEVRRLYNDTHIQAAIAKLRNQFGWDEPSQS